MTDITAPARPLARAQPGNFYFHMALACMAIAFLGFLPSYWIPMAQGTFSEAPVVHIHGMIAFAWSAYFAYQSWLPSAGQIARHRSAGLIGVSLATAMVIFGILIAIYAMRETAAAGHPDVGLNVANAAISNVVLFGGFVLGALVNLRRPEWHKRFMLLAMISVMSPPIARWFMYYLHAPRPPRGPEWIVTLLALVLPLHDWRTRGRVHLASGLGVAAVAIVMLGHGPFAGTGVWRSFAGWLSSLAG